MPQPCQAPAATHWVSAVSALASYDGRRSPGRSQAHHSLGSDNAPLLGAFGTPPLPRAQSAWLSALLCSALGASHWLTLGARLLHFGRCSASLRAVLCLTVSCALPPSWCCSALGCLSHCHTARPLPNLFLAHPSSQCLAVNTSLYFRKFAVLSLIRCALIHWLCSHSLCSQLAGIFTAS